MWSEMQRRNEEMVVAMREHERLCRDDRPDVPAVARVRWRIAETSRHRLEYLIENALPLAERHASGEATERLQRLKDTTAAYRQRISVFIVDWSAEDLIRDWDGYRIATAGVRALMQARLAEEAMVMRLIAQAAAPSRRTLAAERVDGR